MNCFELSHLYFFQTIISRTLKETPLLSTGAEVESSFNPVFFKKRTDSKPVPCCTRTHPPPISSFPNLVHTHLYPYTCLKSRLLCIRNSWVSSLTLLHLYLTLLTFWSVFNFFNAEILTMHYLSPHTFWGNVEECFYTPPSDDYVYLLHRPQSFNWNALVRSYLSCLLHWITRR